MKKPYVAIVDDDSSFAAYLRTFLSLRGYEARCYTRGDEILASMKQNEPPDVVLLDVMMPGLDGLATLRALKGSRPETQVIMLSGRSQVSTIVEAVRLGAAQAADPYVLDAELGNLPPHTGDELAAAIEQALANPAETVDVRAALLATAGPIEAPWVSERIRDAFYSDDRELRQAAVVAMGRSANIDWFEFLEESLLSEDHELRRSAAEAFGEDLGSGGETQGVGANHPRPVGRYLAAPDGGKPEHEACGHG